VRARRPIHAGFTRGAPSGHARPLPPARRPHAPPEEEPREGLPEASATQRWDDHRYYHQSRINQSLHLVSAISFLVAYVLLFVDPALPPSSAGACR
jgi:hypothetical protein